MSLFGKAPSRLALAAAALLSLPAAAGAQAVGSSPSFQATRFSIAPGTEDFLSVYSARTAPPLGFNALVSLDYAKEPLRLVNGGQTVVLIGDQWNLQFAASIGILRWLEVGVVVPGTVSQSGDVASMVNSALANFTPSGGLGDPRIIPRFHIYDIADFSFGAFLPFTIPVGSTHDYTGYGSVTASPAVAAEWSGVKALRIAANFGVSIRPTRTVGDLTVGSAFDYGLAGSYDFPVGPFSFTGLLTLAGEVGIAASSGATYPVEMLGAVRWNAPLGIFATLAGGPGLSCGYGTPNYRAVFAAGFALPGYDARQEKGQEKEKR